MREQAFFEAYLSNFIEGTEFTLDEAVAIVYDQTIPQARPADAHDVTSTYQLISDPEEAGAVPMSGGQLARLSMNAELSTAAQHRILTPLIVRGDYLAGLRR